MKTFKEFHEEFRRANLPAIEGIYKNPTPEELKQIEPYARGIVTTKGDFYVENSGNSPLSFHTKMALRAKELYNDAKIKKFRAGETASSKKLVTVQRFGKSNVFGLGETEGSSKGRGFHAKNKFEKGEEVFVKKILKLAKTKNPKIKFTLKNVEEFADDD